MAEFETNDNQKNASKFSCEVCDYTTVKKSSYDSHNLSAKHKRQQTATELCMLHNCSNCDKKYHNRTGLWRHKKNCIKNENDKNDTNLVEQLLKQNDDFKHLILEQNKMFIGQNQDIQKQTIDIQKQNQDIQKQNHDLQQQILDVCKNGIIQNNTINANSNNKTFNLQVFLNEECKDAMNISDFMSSIQVQLEELECVGRLGFVEGISKIIIKNLKALDIRKRPVHCTDLKRETVYIKENGVWVKDDDSNTKLRKVIKNVSFRNSKNTRLYRDKYPDCVRSESRLSDIYSIIIIEAMGGGSKTDPKESEDKILRRILKELVIDKSRFLS
jgi:hypothetical protein